MARDLKFLPPNHRERIFVPKAPSNNILPSKRRNLVKNAPAPRKVTNPFCLLYTNADSLLNKKQELRMAIRDRQPDLIAITEAMPKRCEGRIEHQELGVHGYDLIWNEETETRHRGICIYVKEGLLVTVEQDLTNFNFEESIWIKIQLEGREDLLLGVIYRSPAQSDLEGNNIELLRLLQEVGKDKAQYKAIVGDFNLPNIKWNQRCGMVAGDKPLEEQFLVTIDDISMEQVIDRPTRYREHQNPSLLDLLLVNNPEIVHSIELRAPLGKSDHVVIEAKLDLSLHISDQPPPKRYNYGKGKYQLIRQEMASIEWDEDLRGLDVDAQWEKIKNTVLKSVERHVPYKKDNRGNKPLWLSPRAEVAIRKRNSAWTKYLHSHRTEDLNKYKVLRNRATQTLRQARKNFEEMVASEFKSNPKSFWRYVRG